MLGNLFHRQDVSFLSFGFPAHTGLGTRYSLLWSHSGVKWRGRRNHSQRNSFSRQVKDSAGPHMGFPGASDGKESARNAEDSGSIPGSGRSPGGGNGNPLQYSCLGNTVDRGAWWATVQRVTKSQTQLSMYTYYFFS